MTAYPAPPPPGGWPLPKHPQATLALVLGIIGLVLCNILAPFAWYIGHKTVSEIDAEPGRYDGRGEAVAGKILGIIGTILCVLGLALLALIVSSLFVAGTTTR